MLLSLYVKNMALIEEAEVEFGPGLNILTGETGAGKSILLGSVDLALGARADKSIIRNGAESALVELVFQIDNEAQLNRIRELDIPMEEDGILVLSRRIMPNRSLCRVNGETIGSRVLQILGGMLIDICGQRDSGQLLKRKKHQEILDAYAGESAAVTKQRIQELYRERNRLEEELAEGDLDDREKQRRISLAQYELEEIQNAAPKIGEDTSLERNFRRMNNSRRIVSTMQEVLYRCGYDSEEGAGEQIGRSLRELNGIVSFDDPLNDYEQMLTDIDNLLSDFSRAVSDYLTELEFDPEDFHNVEERLDTINRLKDKYGSTIEEILAYADAKEEEILALERSEERRQELLAEKEKVEAALMRACEELSEIRTEAGTMLSARMTEALQGLNFLKVGFACDVQRRPQITQEGFDDVIFMISTNPGEPLKPLTDVASGGELSRIMLALKTITAETEDLDTLIFDEIDAGISGRTAWQVSEKLAELAHSRQLLCITHLPQIAAMADTHFVIEKTAREDSTVTQIRRCEETEQLTELARMLGGDEITAQALANAEELTDRAREKKTQIR